MLQIKHLLILFTLSFLGVNAYATHNRAAEITFKQVGPLTVEATITTYTKASSQDADRDSLELFWGDGTSSWAVRTNGNGQGVVLPPDDIQYNVYEASHNYPATGPYTMFYVDPNRNGGIINVNPPFSEQVKFHVSTRFVLMNTQIQGSNSSPILLQPPVDKGCVGEPFVHNPNAFDFEGDSLSYELTVPLEGVGTEVPSYIWPDDVSPGPDNNLSIDPVTGTIIWDAPQQEGEYNIAILIKEYRDGQLISEIMRDMQIRVEECDNKPPEIETIDEICVIAGDTVNFEVLATDPDIPLQQVKLEAFGPPLSDLTSAYDYGQATFSAPATFADQVVEGTFNWPTSCEHVSDQYYQIIFKATDDYVVENGDSLGLSALKTVFIKVVAPAPENLQAEVINQTVQLAWDNPYSCEDTENDFFRGFSIWRRLNSNAFEIDTCAPGIEGKGYERIFSLTSDTLPTGSYTFTDEDVERGRTYCYRVLAEFSFLTDNGTPYNRVQSLPSNEICVQLNRDVPLMTNVSVESTDPANGTVFVQWSKPIAEDLDTIQNPGPYRYQLYRADGQSTTGFIALPNANFISADFANANDTTFLDNNLNTQAQAYSYKVEFYVNNETEPLGETAVAASPFLSIVSSDKQNTLTWSTVVPWDNYKTTIYRLNDGTGVFDSIATSDSNTYVDKGLTNLVEYCYYIETKGTYSIKGVLDPLLNKSQEACGIPIDTVPPCVPTLAVTNPCSDGANFDLNNLYNNLNWTNPFDACNDEDLEGFTIYFAAEKGAEFQPLETIYSNSQTEYTHELDLSLSGCYYIVAFDTLGNISDSSNNICVDNCPLYELPNTFTPNEDGQNDLFVPRDSRFIVEVNFQVFNQWGGLVFETTDPQLNWDGNNMDGKELSEATYYYRCEVYEQRVEGKTKQEEILKGFIELIRSK